MKKEESVAVSFLVFLTFLLFFGGGCGGSRQKMERKFLVLLRRYHIEL
ncbi:MAG: hypothetical protein G01um101448_1231 [Parcubacteria group bacterium Gr01-1014_48]|nr:MAG: hypothetical protein G01um101448_1231 [Parcubacteria group bacterium Gr01-1014_48]